MEATMPASLVENLREFAESRGNVYGFLSRCYEVEIDAAFAEQVAERFSFSSDDPRLAASLDAMKRDLADQSEEHLEQLAVVFDRVFFGMGPRTAQKAFPYESVYTSSEGLLMQEAYSKAVSAYRQERLAKNPSFPEPEDHLAVELAFMQSLCERTASALSMGDESEAERLFAEQRAFIDEHLLTWIERFASDAKVSAESGFYWHLAAFTEEFLKADSEALAGVLG